MPKILMLFLSVTVCGCALVSLLKPEPQKVLVVKRNLHVRWELMKPKELVMERTETCPKYDIHYFVYKSYLATSVKRNDFMRGELLKQKSGSKRLVVLISGMGESVSTKPIAEALADDGYDVLRLYSKIQIFNVRELQDADTLEKTEFPRFVHAGALVLEARYKDYFDIILEIKNSNSYEFTGIYGVSLGGITAFYLAGSHPELFNSVIGAVTGGNLAEILLVSSEPGIKKTRDLVMEKFGITIDEARIVLRKELVHIDPLAVASALDPRQALIISNFFDTVIPNRFTRELWNASNRPRWKITAIKLPVFWATNNTFWLDGHYSSGLALFAPTPFFEFFGSIPILTSFKSVNSIVLDHFYRTL